MRPKIIHNRPHVILSKAFRELPDGTFFTMKREGGLFQKTDRDHAFIWEPTSSPSAAGPDVQSPGWAEMKGCIPVRVRIEVTHEVNP